MCFRFFVMFSRFWADFRFFDVKISFYIKFCFRCTLPEVCTTKNWAFHRFRTQGMSFFEYKECPSSNTRIVFLRTQGMFFFEHKECLSPNTRNVFLRTYGMSFAEHKDCPPSNTRNVFLRTQG